MCHEMPLGITRLAHRLRVPRKAIEAKASGINHFTFFTEFRDGRTGEDLMPRIREYYEGRYFDYTPRTQRVLERLDRRLPGATFVEFYYIPLVAHVVRTHGLIPCSVDSHIGEYLPFATEVADWQPTPLDFHEPIMVVAEKLSTWVADTKVPLPLQAMGPSREEVAAILDAMWNDEPTWIMATNVPNRGYLPDLPDGAIVEVGATVDGDGIHPDTMPPARRPAPGLDRGPAGRAGPGGRRRPAGRPGPGLPGRGRGPVLAPRRGVLPQDVRRAPHPPGRQAPLLTPRGPLRRPRSAVGSGHQ